MAKHVVFVGGGHAHLTALKQLSDFIGKGHRVTLISPSAYQYYSGMGPGMLSGIYRFDEARFDVGKMAERRGGRFIENTVVKVDAGNRILLLKSGEAIEYDVASFNTGSEVAMGAFGGSIEHVIPVKPVSNLHSARCSILSEVRNKNLRVLIIGGGAAGVEVAANVWRLKRDHSINLEVTLAAHRRVLEGVPLRIRQLAMRSLTEKEIRVMEGTKIVSVDGKNAILSDGSSLPFDYAFAAVGVRPSTLFHDSGIPTREDGSMLVNEYLQSVAHRELFGGGDCISMAAHKMDKVGVYAVRQNPILHHNLMAALEETEMKAFIPDRSYMLILNMGDGKGILWKDRLIWNGRFSFLLKDYIDRRFMKKFQESLS